MRRIITAGIIEHRAVMPHAKNMYWMPRRSARKPKNTGAAVLAMLVDNEFML